jgi:two-component system response regulator FixJ
MRFISVVDDDLSVRRALERLLRAAGYAVSSHASGTDFLLSLETSLPECVVLDLHMPGLTGFDVVEALGAKAPSMPVVVLTADHNSRTCDEALGRGAAACLRKPIDEALLLEMIAGALRQNVARSML